MVLHTFTAWSRLYAALARVEKPGDALLHPRLPPSSSCPKDVHRGSFHNAGTSSSYSYNGPAPITSSSPLPRPLSQPQAGTKRDHCCSSLSDEAAAAVVEATPTRGNNPPPTGCRLSETDVPSTGVRPLSEGDSGQEVSAALKGHGDLRLNGSCGETIVSATPRSAEHAAMAQQSGRLKRFHTSWKARLKRDLATGREPTGTFTFSGQRL